MEQHRAAMDAVVVQHQQRHELHALSKGMIPRLNI
jgi:hypothetical protein